ncbi:serine/threonine-protein phosphatase 6 regulatory ankyrin repeat subunit A-like isoform X7 [Portunus trituberculatus]|uniref:serine/threonine-protein phosphatase 6 regulatory ankyrin repeat subunit A-like isoform X7 n=1 Tax=Portunus trituberculatus TaxID=210409 RepID=UPI001E1CD3E5|nr:serine/threonine-protein phosphatase 6 regulatory ankyrin repeat subunit A-like isoform X7 [Portunus trituberculatus]
MTAAVAGVGVEMAGGSVGGREEPAEPVPGPSEGVTPLMYACQQGRDHTVRQIIHRKPSSVQERDRTGKTALHYCVENQTLSCIDQVVEAEKGLIGARDEDGYTPLHLATIAGNKAVVQYLLGRGADVKAVDNEKHTAVHWATVCGEVELLEMLMEAGADASTPDLHGAYPLHYAAQMCGPNSEMGNDVRVGLQVLRKLLQYGVDVSVTDHDGRTPLLWAASAEVRPSHVYCPSGSADAILALINAGASVSADDKDGLTALHCAASRGHLDCLDCLLNFCGAEVDTLDSNGCTPLFYAVTLGHADCTGLLLHHGAHPDKQDRKGRTPAHCGAAKGQLETLKLLHHKGADLWKRNVKGDLPLHEACQSGRRDLVLWLLSMRPDTVNAPNLDGRCPLHIAAINNNIEMCKILMDKQAAVNPIMRNSRGQLLTPLDAAVARSNRGCAKYLQLHGGMAASKLTDKHALQKAMQRALETSQQGSREQEGEELMSSSASSVHKSNRSTMTASPVNMDAQTETTGGAGGVDGMKDAQEPGFSDGLAVGRESDVDGLTDPERHTEDEENAEAGRRKSRTRRRKEKHRGRSGEEQLASGQVRDGKVESMESSLRRKGRKMASPSTEVSITQAMQNTMRKYALERRLFQQLLELKRAQIRNSRANEHVLIKRMVDVFHKEGMLLGLRGYSGPYNFNSYEKYLYDQLRFLQSSQGIKIPAFRPTDDVEKLSRAIRRAEIKELPDPLQNNMDAHTCNHTTHRCHHAAHAYTGIPCAAYTIKFQDQRTDILGDRP